MNPVIKLLIIVIAMGFSSLTIPIQAEQPPVVNEPAAVPTTQKDENKMEPIKEVLKETIPEPAPAIVQQQIAPKQPTVTGTCEDWMSQAGVTHPIATDLITRESGCNPCAYNPGQSDCNYKGNMACGIPQALPCSKLRDVAGCAMTDAVCQLKWMQNYVMARYGSWESALAFHNANNWY